MKTCNKCGVEKSIEEFGHHPTCRDGLRPECRDCKNVQGRKYAKRPEVKARARVASLAWFNAHATEQKEKAKLRHRSNRQIVLKYYNAKCVCCGETRNEFLAVDHIHGGGSRHRKAMTVSTIYRWIIKNDFPQDFRILCHNCNQSRGSYGYCPHESEKRDTINSDVLLTMGDACEAGTRVHFIKKGPEGRA